MSIRLDDEDLQAVPIDSLERLAKFLGITIVRQAHEPEGPYRHKLTKAIQRWEKQYGQGNLS